MPPESNRLKSAIIIFISIVIIAASFGGGLYVGYERRPAIDKVKGVLGQETQKPQEVDFNMFWEVWSRLEEKYVDRAKIDRTKLVQTAIAGLVKGLGDPHTVYFPPVEAKQFQEDVRGNFGGIGAEIGIRKDILTIITPLKGSPAEKAGLLAGDKVLKIGATTTADLSVEEAVSFIRGEIGTTVTLSVSRESWNEIKEIKIKRDNIVIPTIDTARKPDGIFYIHLLNFNEKSPEDFERALREFSESGDRKLLFDLRGNPGGYLSAAVDIASWFMPAGEVVAREKFADGSERLYRSSGRKSLENTPVVVLVNQGSASASEILAGALRDIRGIKLVGDKTFGKGSVQELDNLRGGASLKITIAKWLTPKGTSIDGTGLEPDIKVEVKKEDIENNKDPQMEKALEILKEM